MADHFALELDTTGPQIDVYMPSYTTPEAYNEIVVQANEPLAPWQDFYFVDALGERHDVIFAHDGDRFVGVVRFNDYPLGFATLYAQVRDEVYNLSPLLSKAIHITQGAVLMVHGSWRGRHVDMREQVCRVDIDNTVRTVSTRVDARRIEVKAE